MTARLPDEIDQLDLWRVSPHSQAAHHLACVSMNSRPDPASPRTRAAERVSPHSQGHLIVGLDTGERPGKTVATDGTNVVRYRDPLEFALDPRWPSGAMVVFETSACSLKPALRKAFYEAMKRRGLKPYPVLARDTKSHRRDWYPDIEKTKREQFDELDAEVLRRIGEERRIPPVRWNGKYRRELSSDALVRARQLGYDLEHEDMPKWISAAIRVLTSQRPPDCARVCGAAIESKRNGGWVWIVDYRLITPAVVAVKSGGSWRKAKTVLRRPGVARSNLMFHPLRGRPRDERRVIMRAQLDLVRWCMGVLKSAGALVPTIREVA